MGLCAHFGKEAYHFRALRYSSLQVQVHRDISNVGAGEHKKFQGHAAGLSDCGLDARLTLRYNVESLCRETIRCPGLTGLFDYEKEALREMQEQVNHNAGSALEYYISHVLYLSRKEVRGY